MNVQTVLPAHRTSWFSPAQCLAYYNKPYQLREIQIHWWGDPSTKPTHDGVVNYIRNKAGGSVNYVASAGRVTRMVDEPNCAITTQNGNPYGIKIECSPYGTDADYETIATLIADIRRRRGDLPLTPHNKYWNTACPGTLDLGRLDREAKAIMEGNAMEEKVVWDDVVMYKQWLGLGTNEGDKGFVGGTYRSLMFAICQGAEYQNAQKELREAAEQGGRYEKVEVYRKLN